MLRPLRNWWTLVVLFMFILMPMPLLAEDVGHFKEVFGNVELFNPQKTQPLLVKPQSAVAINDRIKTEATSRAQVQFVDASIMTISPRSNILIESFMFNRQKGLLNSLSTLTEGLVRLVVPVEKLEKRDFLVRTPTAIMGIRGTEVYVLIGPDFTDIFVKKGSVAVAPNKDAAGGGKRSSLSPEELKYVERMTRQASIRAQITGNITPLTDMLTAYLAQNATTVPPNFAVRSTFAGAGTPVGLPPGGFGTLNAALQAGLPPASQLGNTSNPLGTLQTIQQSQQPAGATGAGAGSPPGPPASSTGTSGTGGGGGGGAVASPSS